MMEFDEAESFFRGAAARVGIDLSGWTVTDTWSGSASAVTPAVRRVYLSDEDRSMPGALTRCAILHELGHVHQVNSGRITTTGVGGDLVMHWNGEVIYSPLFSSPTDYSARPWERDADLFMVRHPFFVPPVSEDW